MASCSWTLVMYLCTVALYIWAIKKTPLMHSSFIRRIIAFYSQWAEKEMRCFLCSKVTLAFLAIETSELMAHTEQVVFKTLIIFILHSDLDIQYILFLGRSFKNRLNACLVWLSIFSLKHRLDTQNYNLFDVSFTKRALEKKWNQ